MENIEELVEETENVEQTTEEIETTEEGTPEVEEPKEETFTKSQVDEIVKKRLGRQESKLRKEYANKYGKLETVVNAGLGTHNTEEAVEKLTEFYSQKGINIPTEPIYSDRDVEVLADAEANEIISYGYDEIVSETDRLANLGANMSQRDRLVFTKLANARKQMEEEKELAAMGVTELDSEFKEFEKKLNPELSMKEKYDMYLAQKPKKENKIIGSMKGTPENRVKDYYSPEEIAKLTDEDLDNPQIWEAVRKSMTKRN
jgi:hypothetical protein